MRSKITNKQKIKFQENFQESFIKWQKLKHIKQMENNCHIPD